jgi:hypothetical protein
LLADRRKVLEIWDKVFGNFGANKWRNTLEVCGKLIRRLGENLFGDFGQKFVGILFGEFGEIVRRFGEIVWR